MARRSFSRLSGREIMCILQRPSNQQRGFASSAIGRRHGESNWGAGSLEIMLSVQRVFPPLRRRPVVSWMTSYR